MGDVPNSIVEAVQRYHDEYRNPLLPPPDIKGLYALFPIESPSIDPAFNWPASWPNAELPGAYVVLGKERNILYVGKSAVLGPRVGHYFPESRDGLRRCIIRHTWQQRPMFVVFIAIGKWFEAPSLEEYLIESLKPLENKLWTDRGRNAPAADLMGDPP